MRGVALGLGLAASVAASPSGLPLYRIEAHADGRPVQPLAPADGAPARRATSAVGASGATSPRRAGSLGEFSDTSTLAMRFPNGDTKVFRCVGAGRWRTAGGRQRRGA